MRHRLHETYGDRKAASSVINWENKYTLGVSPPLSGFISGTNFVVILMSDEIIAAAGLFSLFQRNPFFINSGSDYTLRAKFLLHVTPLRQRLYPGDGLSPHCLNSMFAFLCSRGDKGKAFFLNRRKIRKSDVFLHNTGHLRCKHRQLEMIHSCPRVRKMARLLSSKYLRNILFSRERWARGRRSVLLAWHSRDAAFAWQIWGQ